MIRTATLTLIALFATACVGTTAREEVLVPSMQVVWPQLEALALIAANDQRAFIVEQFSSALATSDPSEIVAVPFEPIRVMVLDGILIRVGEGTLGPFGAGSYRENLDLFTQAYLKLKEKY